MGVFSEQASWRKEEYAGNYIYKNGVLEFFNQPEGIVEKEADGYKYVYQYKDHLGNIRLSYKDFNKDGAITQDEIVQEKNYYPFGLTHKGYNGILRGRNHNYGYNGKEEQPELGLDWVDYGARNYDASLGRWMNIDPLAEVYYGMNPYGYVFNNPVQLFDPDGMRVKYVRQEGQSRKEFRQARREFKRTNRRLSRDSKTHKQNFKTLKKSKNTHSISFNRGKGSSIERVGAKNRETGNDTNVNIDLNQESDGDQGNEFVIAHELSHVVDDDNGSSSPIEADINILNDSPRAITQKSLDASNQNKEINESNASHIENIIRGEVSNSRGVKIPLRATYTIGVESFNFGQYDIKSKVINVIKKNYDYYKKSKSKTDKK